MACGRPTMRRNCCSQRRSGLRVERGGPGAHNRVVMTSTTIEAARGGDAAALERLMQERRAEVVRYAVRLCLSPEDAEDATQEALLALSRYVAALRELAALSRWLFRAVRTHCFRLARRSMRYVPALDGDASLALEGPSPEEQLVDRQLRHRLSQIMSDIDPALRDALLRRDVLGESGEEAAAALGLSLRAFKSRLHRGRAEVRKRFLLSIRDAPGNR